MIDRELKEIMESHFIGILSTNQTTANDVQRSSVKALAGFMELQDNKTIWINGHLDGYSTFHSAEVKITKAFLNEKNEIMVECVDEESNVFEERMEYVSGFDVYDIIDTWRYSNE